MARLLIPLVVGVIAVAAAMALGASGGNAGNGLETWSPALRAGLVGASVAIGLVLLGRAVTMLADDDVRSTAGPNRDVRPMIRAVRLAFLAVAAFAAAGAFLVGHPLLLVVALVIAGIDVIETSFLLLVARTHHGDGRSER
ncbi:MAG TPA: hypothetical protein VFV72_17390 [Candidatus Limnocylindrales bacterium]|nr:hypothetical protein [Candidatus Limnocylindrales bacterium]